MPRESANFSLDYARVAILCIEIQIKHPTRLRTLQLLALSTSRVDWLFKNTRRARNLFSRLGFRVNS